MNKLGYILSGLCYILLSFAYVFRGKIKIGNIEHKFEHRHMQLIVSILYMTLGYIYFADGVFDKFTFEDINEEKINDEQIKQKKKEKRIIQTLGLYIILIFLTVFIDKKYISKDKD